MLPAQRALSTQSSASRIRSYRSTTMTKLSFVALMLIAALPAFANDQPFVVSSPFNSATPFNVTLPATTADGKAVKTVVIEFVTADCQAVTGVAAIGAAE